MHTSSGIGHSSQKPVLCTRVISGVKWVFLIQTIEAESSQKCYFYSKVTIGPSLAVYTASIGSVLPLMRGAVEALFKLKENIPLPYNTIGFFLGSWGQKSSLTFDTPLKRSARKWHNRVMDFFVNKRGSTDAFYNVSFWFITCHSSKTADYFYGKSFLGREFDVLIFGGVLA